MGQTAGGIVSLSRGVMNIVVRSLESTLEGVEQPDPVSDPVCQGAPQGEVIL